MIPHAKIRNALRRVWLYEVSSAIRRNAKIGGKWICDECEQYTNKVEIDHREPVGRTPGSKFATEKDTWDSFMKRLFCLPHQYQVLCKACHEKKGKL